MAVTIKTRHEIELMRESNHRLEKVFDAMEKMIRPGISTWEIDQAARKLIKEQGGIPNFLNYEGYPASICVSVNDEVVHGKGTILQKMSGNYEEKFSQARAMYLYMMVHPGKKLNFMGNEIGQLREWNEKREQDWSLRKYPAHDSFYRYMSELNKIYLSHPALYKADYQEYGFKWLDCNQHNRCIYAIERRSDKERIIGIFNFSAQKQIEYNLKIHNAGKLYLLLNTDWECFSGNTFKDKKIYSSANETFSFDIPPFSGILMKVN